MLLRSGIRNKAHGDSELNGFRESQLRNNEDSYNDLGLRVATMSSTFSFKADFFSTFLKRLN